jgi:hypothetical protein
MEMSNPFTVRWLTGWTFQTVLMEGQIQVEAHGFGICLRSAVRQGESPVSAADRLVFAEDQRRRALHRAWLRGERLNELPEPTNLMAAVPEPATESVPPLGSLSLIKVAA